MSKWDHRFLRIAHEVSTWSKDPSTKVGAVIVNHKMQILSVGYNGFPRSVEDKHELLQDREKKYPRVVHAEVNAILAARIVSGDSITMYVTHMPCSRCAAVIAQNEVARVVAPTPDPDYAMRWQNEIDIAKEIFLEADVAVTLYPSIRW